MIFDHEVMKKDFGEVLEILLNLFIVSGFIFLDNHAGKISAK